MPKRARAAAARKRSRSGASASSGPTSTIQHLAAALRHGNQKISPVGSQLIGRLRERYRRQARQPVQTVVAKQNGRQHRSRPRGPTLAWALSSRALRTCRGNRRRNAATRRWSCVLGCSWPGVMRSNSRSCQSSLTRSIWITPCGMSRPSALCIGRLVRLLVKSTLSWLSDAPSSDVCLPPTVSRNCESTRVSSRNRPSPAPRMSP